MFLVIDSCRVRGTSYKLAPAGAFSLGPNFTNYDTDLTSYFNQNIATGEHAILDAGLILYFNGSGNHHFLQANSISGSKPVWEIVDTGYGGTKYINKTMSTVVPIY